MRKLSTVRNIVPAFVRIKWRVPTVQVLQFFLLSSNFKGSRTKFEKTDARVDGSIFNNKHVNGKFEKVKRDALYSTVIK